MKYEIVEIKIIEKPKIGGILANSIFKDEEAFITVKFIPDNLIEKIFYKTKIKKYIGSGSVWNCVDTGRYPPFGLDSFLKIKYKLYQLEKDGK